jgi:CdiI immunity protein
MSRRTREIRLQAQERWPNLFQFLAAYLHEDWPRECETPEAAVEQALSETGHSQLKFVASEWWTWNATEGAKHDPRLSVNEGLGVNVWFNKPEKARQFMNMVYDKLIVVIRKEEKGWKP